MFFNSDSLNTFYLQSYDKAARNAIHFTVFILHILFTVLWCQTTQIRKKGRKKGRKGRKYFI